MPKVEEVCQKLRKCAKSQESLPKLEKLWESVPKAEKVCQNLRKCAKSWESVPKAKKVWDSMPKNVCKSFS